MEPRFPEVEKRPGDGRDPGPGFLRAGPASQTVVVVVVWVRAFGGVNSLGGVCGVVVSRTDLITDLPACCWIAQGRVPPKSKKASKDKLGT